MTWAGGSASPSLPVFALLVGIAIVAAVMLWSLLRALWRTPGHIKRHRRERRIARGRHAITQGLLAIGHGDSASARAHAETARRHAAQDPLTLLLHAQSAQLDGDRNGRAARLPRHGRARGHAGCSACAACSSKPSAPTIRSPP